MKFTKEEQKQLFDVLVLAFKVVDESEFGKMGKEMKLLDSYLANIVSDRVWEAARKAAGEVPED